MRGGGGLGQISNPQDGDHDGHLPEKLLVWPPCCLPDEWGKGPWHPGSSSAFSATLGHSRPLSATSWAQKLRHDHAQFGGLPALLGSRCECFVSHQHTSKRCSPGHVLAKSHRVNSSVCCIGGLASRLFPFAATARHMGSWQSLIWVNVITLCGTVVLLVNDLTAL